MPQAKRTKAATATGNAHTLQMPRNGAWSRNAHGVGAMAQTLAAWQRLSYDMNEAGGLAKKELEKLSADDETAIKGDPYNRIFMTRSRFQRIEEAARAKARALEKLIAELEPQTTDEVLSMLLVFDSALDAYVGNHCSTATDTEASLDFVTLRRTILAMIRGLICAGASSPLLGHCTVTEDLETWEEALRTAEPEATARLASEGSAQ